MTANGPTLPTYSDLMYPVLQAVDALGGSASGREINDWLISHGGFTDEQVAVTYAKREGVSVLLDRMDWARSYCKLSGALDSPKRKLFLLSPLGREILSLPEEEARQRLLELDRQVRAERGKQKRQPADANVPRNGGSSSLQPGTDEEDELADPDDEDDAWKMTLLRRLHALTPPQFEEFVIYLLKEFDMELTRVGGPNDEGIDGIGTAPLSEVLSATVAVQVKRYDPDDEKKPIGRSVVALFQRDAAEAGAERAVLVTLGRFSPVAQRTAVSSTPRVDLIDGEKLCELVLSKGLGVTLQPVVHEGWFDRFG